MKKINDIFIQGWIVFAKYFYFSFMMSILLIPAGLIPLTVSCFIKIKEPVWAMIHFVSLILLTPFACYLTFKITKLLGPQISFPIMCPKCGSFVERKDAKKE